MVCEIENDEVEEMNVEVLSSMWPEYIDGAGKQFNIDRPHAEQDMLQEVNIIEEPKIYDFQRLVELTSYSEKGSSQLAYLVKNWEYKQANARRLLREELDNLSKQKHAVELKQLEIIEEHRFVEESYGGDKRPISILDGVYDIWPAVPRRKNEVVVENKALEVEAEYDTVIYWKQRAKRLEELLAASVEREQILMDKLQESIKNLERQSSPVEEFSQILERADNFLHFILQTAPVVIGHQDKELKYRFIYNHFPSLNEEEIIGKTDVEIFTGAGVKESEDFKREVLERGLPAKREITFETELFGSKTFLIYVEPVFSKAGDTIGINYMGMEVTDQVIKREKMAKIREEIAVQKAMETELNKTIRITEETMRAKQMLATMSHEIRSPLSGVVSMVEILSTTPLDKEQRKLIKVMLSSGDLVLQLINDILDLSKVESGVMKLEATKFRPREVVRHVLQTAAASLQKMLILEGDVRDDVPIEIIGDVLRIRQILTNLISNAIKFTHDGKVGIRLYVIPEPSSDIGESRKKLSSDRSDLSENGLAAEKNSPRNQDVVHANGFYDEKHNGNPSQNHTLEDEPKTPLENGHSLDGNDHSDPRSREETVWLQCDVYDTGIGIPESALPTLFNKYMQAGADTARKYGGTGLGLAICKQLVELMGGHLTVSSREHHGSTFTFVVPYKISKSLDESYDPNEFSDMVDHDAIVDPNDDDSNCGLFQFQPRALGSLFTSSCSNRSQRLSRNGSSLNISNKISMRFDTEEVAFIEDVSSMINGDESSFINGNLANGEIKYHSSDENGQVTQVTNPFVFSSQPSWETKQKRDHDEASDIQDRYMRSSQCTSSNCSEFPKSSSKPRILLVDDNKINVMVARSMMKQLGHNIDVVNNGIEAVQAVQCHIYDLVLMDVFMPLMDGLQATRLIRSFEETGNWNAAIQAGIEHVPPNSVPCDHEVNLSRKRIPIIAMTANSLSESAEECYANGMDSFVSKPVTFQKLKECLERYVS